MSKLLSYLIPALLLLALFGGIAFKLKQNKDISQERVYHYTPSENPVAAQEDEPLLKPIDSQFTGVFEPNREAKISAEAQGKIKRMLVDAGSPVTKGQPLVLLDNSLLQLQLKEADIKIEGLADDVERYTALVEADAVQGVQLEKAQLGLRSAQAQRAILQEQINKTTVEAPFSGVVFAKLSEEGSFAAPGVPLLHLLDLDPMRFNIKVPEGELYHFKMGRDYPILADALPGQTLNGKVSMIASMANPGNTFTVQFQVQNTKGLGLRAGMFGTVTLPAQNR